MRPETLIVPITFGVRPVAVRFTVAAANSSWMRYPTKTVSAALTLHVPSADERLSAVGGRVRGDRVDAGLGRRGVAQHEPPRGHPGDDQRTTAPTTILPVLDTRGPGEVSGTLRRPRGTRRASRGGCGRSRCRCRSGRSVGVVQSSLPAVGGPAVAELARVELHVGVGERVRDAGRPVARRLARR